MDGLPLLNIMKELYYLVYTAENRALIICSTTCSARTYLPCGHFLLAMSALTHLSVGDYLHRSRMISFKLRPSLQDTAQLEDNSNGFPSFLIRIKPLSQALQSGDPGQCLLLL